MTDMRIALQQGLQDLHLALSEQTQQTLCDFGGAVLRQNAVMNLTAITQPDKVATLHLVDSLCLLTVEPFSGKRVIDVGCGAGFPGVPLKIACPSIELTLLDSLGKRIAWLEQTLPSLGIDADCVTARAEEAVSARREQYDIAVSRAVARLRILLELTAPFVRVGGCVLAMKGSAAAQELAESKNAIARLGLRLEQCRDFSVDGACHTVITLRKIAETPAAYPRRFAKIKQSPL